jgi:hypothetical protein
MIAMSGSPLHKFHPTMKRNLTGDFSGTPTQKKKILTLFASKSAAEEQYGRWH